MPEVFPSFQSATHVEQTSLYIQRCYCEYRDWGVAVVQLAHNSVATSSNPNPCTGLEKVECFCVNFYKDIVGEVHTIFP